MLRLKPALGKRYQRTPEAVSAGAKAELARVEEELGQAVAKREAEMSVVEGELKPQGAAGEARGKYSIPQGNSGRWLVA